MATDKETKILIVDDMAYSRMSIKKNLTNFGFANANIETAVDGVDALKKCTRFMPDIAILDLMLPKINGLNLIGLLLGINYKIKILICSVITDTTVYQKALAKGAIDWIQKPVNEELLKTKIETLVKEKSNFTEKDMYDLKTEGHDFSEKIGIKLNLDEKLQILNVYGKFGVNELKDLKETISALRIYNYKNVILNFNGVTEFKISADDIIKLKSEIEKEQGKFMIVLLKGKLKDELSKTNLINNIVKTKIQALRKFKPH